MDKKLAKRQKAAVKLLQNVEAERKPFCAAHVVPDYDGTKYQSFHNGFIGFMLKEELPDLPLIEPMNIVKTINETESRMQYGDTQHYKPSRRDIIEHIKKQKLENKAKGVKEVITYHIGNHVYNAEYLISAMEILGGDIELSQDESKRPTPGILKSENGKAIVMAVRP